MENIVVRHLTMNDYRELQDSMIETCHNWAGSYWKEHHMETLLNLFPEGQIAVTSPLRPTIPKEMSYME